MQYKESIPFGKFLQLSLYCPNQNRDMDQISCQKCYEVSLFRNALGRVGAC